MLVKLLGIEDAEIRAAAVYALGEFILVGPACHVSAFKLLEVTKFSFNLVFQVQGAKTFPIFPLADTGRSRGWLRCWRRTAPRE
jgi:hypothetical protein